MAEAFKNKRAVFVRGKQRTFLEQVSKKLSIAAVARISSCSERTIREWRREKFSMPLAVVHKLSARACIQVPKSFRVRDAYAHIARASRMGLAAVIKKYGGIPRNEKYRKERWRLWWESIGRFEKNLIFESKPVHKPKPSIKLAEFIGIMMGDGGISKYQVVVTLHHVDDLEYSTFVAGLMQELFKVTPSIYHSPKQSVNDIVVSRKELVQYLHELELPIGNKVKQQFDIPKWIKRNRKFSIACLRGLIDTDGSVFTHQYCVKDTQYAYKKLSFTSASEPLRQSVYALLQKLGLHPRMTGTGVRLDRVEDMKQYFSNIGSHNPKHLRRYESAVG